MNGSLILWHSFPVVGRKKRIKWLGKEYLGTRLQDPRNGGMPASLKAFCLEGV
jgi:hypothetical protein